MNIDDDTAGITVGDPSNNTTEAGATATVSVVLNTQPTADVTIGVSSSDTTEGTVTSSLTFTPANWNTPQNITVTGVDDDLDDGDISYNVVLAAATSSDSNYNGLNPADKSLLNIDDDSSSISIDDVTKYEGNSPGTTNFEFKVTLDIANTSQISVHYETVDGIATIADSDYVYTSGDLQFTGNAGETKTITVVVNRDDIVEDTETFFVKLSNPQNVSISDDQGIGTIKDDDGAVSIDDISLLEGNSETKDFTFTLTRNGDISEEATVEFTTNDGSAKTSNNDYDANNGIATFAAGSAQTSITIVVNGDVDAEVNETFTVNLSNPINTTISDSQGLGTILDDDGSLSINDVSLPEGNEGTTDFIFIISRSGDISQDATVDFTTNDGTATISDNDYVANFGTATISAGSATASITVVVNGDRLQESDEIFTIDLSNPINILIADNQGVGTIENDDKSGGDNQWDTRPTFGVSHEERQTMIVDNGFSFNGNSFMLTDNHHTPFSQQSIEIGSLNSFAAKVYASKGLKVQEFLFGVPEVGMGHLAEMRVEVWYDFNGEIDEVKVLQDTEVIDRTSLTITHQKAKCQDNDTEEKCDTTFLSAVFLEPLKDKVMAIKAMDFKLRDQTTYLNEGFDVSGDSLNPMPSTMIPSTVKGEGLIKVTQNAKYSDYWTTDDGRIFEKNTFGTFTQINYDFKRFQDSGEAKNRSHSGFANLVQSEAKKAQNTFDATSLVSELPDSFSYDLSIGERITDELIQEMIIQEHIAQKKYDEMYNKQTRWN